MAIWALAGLLPLFASACEHAPSATTPKQAAAIFAKAAKAGDMDTLHKVAFGTDAEFDLAKGFGEQAQAFEHFSAAAADKFGTDGNTRGMSLDIASELDSTEEKIDGDSAQLISNAGNGEESEPIRLKKIDGGWKIDLSFLDKDAAARESSEKLPAVAKVWDKATEEVKAGKFDTFAHAKAAVGFRLKIVRLGEAAGRLATARADISSFEAALEEYKKDAGEYPLTSDGLIALTQKPAAASNWHGPYLKATILNDPWGHPYIYESPGHYNISAYDIHSMGPDGKDQTADDITDWTATPQ
ncbi:MAG TPA: type II secretion system protein GspG [Tepidisphaeraceae bacterium]|jgi:type II secretion system protein G|nr:type II secretion system protein GspG [Tepidisphaeraceae bacterium]